MVYCESPEMKQSVKYWLKEYFKAQQLESGFTKKGGGGLGVVRGKAVTEGFAVKPSSLLSSISDELSNFADSLACLI